MTAGKLTSAGNKIPKGSYIGTHAGELLTEQQGETRDRCVRDAKQWTCVCVDSCGKLYDVYGRTYPFSVDFHHLKFEMDDQDKWVNLYAVDAYHAGNVSAR